MIIIKFLLLVVAIFTSLLWVMKLAIDFASSILGGAKSNEENEGDAYYRILLIGVMSILWALIIIL